MDEATSNIDEKTDKIIESVIRTKMQGTTIISVAHKLMTVLDYDQILVFDHGVAVERGNSQELYKRKGVFYHMVNESPELKKKVQ